MKSKPQATKGKDGRRKKRSSKHSDAEKSDHVVKRKDRKSPPSLDVNHEEPEKSNTKKVHSENGNKMSDGKDVKSSTNGMPQKEASQKTNEDEASTKLNNNSDPKSIPEGNG